MKKFKIHIVIFIVLLSCGQINAQDAIEKQLQDLAKEVPALNEKVNLSVSDVSIQEFLRAVANNTQLNLNIDPKLDFTVTNNFSEVKVLDMLIFLYKQFDLDISIIGNIISIAPNEKKEPVKKYIPKPLDITYDEMNDLLSVSLKKDTLSQVLETITKKSKKNVIATSDLNNYTISGYIQNMPFESVLEKLAFSNKLEMEKTKDGFYLFKSSTITQSDNQNVNIARNNRNTNPTTTTQNDKSDFIYEISALDSITLSAVFFEVDEVILYA